MKTKRLDKRTRTALKKRVISNARDSFISQSSLYNNLGCSYYGGMTRKSAYLHIKENQENKIINRLDKLLKVC